SNRCEGKGDAKREGNGVERRDLPAGEHGYESKHSRKRKDRWTISSAGAECNEWCNSNTRTGGINNEAAGYSIQGRDHCGDRIDRCRSKGYPARLEEGE